MATDKKPETRGEDGTTINSHRRRLLKLAGAGAGLATIGGMSMPVVGHEGEAATDTGGSESSTASAAEHFIADLVDPVFGYPLSMGESDDLSLDHVVEATIEEGQGVHENFPQEPDEGAPGQFVEIPAEFIFDPVGLHVEPGSLVHFNLTAGLHTVTAFHEKFSDPHLDIPTRVPENVPGFTSPPLTPGESWVYQFCERGVYDYLCFPHLGLGMVGRIVVFDQDEDDIESDQFRAQDADGLFPNVQRVLDADELDPANIVDVGSVSWDELTLAEMT